MRANFASLTGIAVFALLINGLAAEAQPSKSCVPGDIPIEKLIVMPNPNGHVDWNNAIDSATSSIHMTMYHLTDAEVISHLTAKMQSDPKMDIKIILDGDSLTGGYAAAILPLINAGAKVIASSKGFSLTHSKDMVIDGKRAIISAINLTNTATNSRDFGIITTSRSVIKEIESVFAADLLNAQAGTTTTPPVSHPNLVWSPVNSDAKLTAFIDAARATLDVESETFDATDIITHLNQAAARGVSVRLIVPECIVGNGAFNYPFLESLVGVNIQVEPNGNSVAQPYMHSKMMVADTEMAYVGSINYTFNSIGSVDPTTGAVSGDRELGVIFSDPVVASQLASEFDVDWDRSKAMATPAPTCGAK